MKFHIIIALMLSFLSLKAGAAAPSLDLLTQEEADNVSKEFSANFVHAPVSGASSLGDIFGFEVGIIGGVTKTPDTEALSKKYDPSTEAGKLPHAGIYGALSVPFNLTVELSIIPETTASNVSLSHTSLGVKWNAGSHFNLPVDFALRAHTAFSDLSYKDTINNSSTGNLNVDSKITYDTSSYGLNLTLSKKLLFVEPYAGVGFVSSKTEIGTEANVSIFTFNTSGKYEASNSGAHLFLGANLNLFVVKLGAEYSNVMGVNKATGKLSFYF